MSEPVRLREAGSALERKLTSSADIDTPMDGAKQRAFATLGIVAGASVAPAVATAAAKRALFGIHLSSSAKIVSVVAIASATAIGGYEVHAHHAATHASESVHLVPVAVPATPISAAPTLDMPMPIEIAPSSAPRMIATPRASRELEPHDPASTSRPHHDDVAELDWIDRAQSALKTNPARALEIVDGYRQNVSPRAFDEEATVVAIEASERTGAPERAQREADQFFVTYPHSAYRSRIEALLASGADGAK